MEKTWKSGSGMSLMDVMSGAEERKAEAADMARSAVEMSRKLKLAGDHARRERAEDAANGAYAAARDARQASVALWAAAERYANAARCLGRVLDYLDGKR